MTGQLGCGIFIPTNKFTFLIYLSNPYGGNAGLHVKHLLNELFVATVG